jgi:transcriptional regulator with XRE-family HTH domain
MPDPNPISVAVRKLREALGETQQQFAFRSRMAIRTIARYETSRPPKGKALLDFMRLAKASGRPVEFEVFRTAIAEETVFILADIAESPEFLARLAVRRPAIAPSSRDDLDFETLSLMKREPDKYKEELRKWNEISAKARAEAVTKKSDVFLHHSILHMIKELAKEGNSPLEIQDEVRAYLIEMTDYIKEKHAEFMEAVKRLEHFVKNLKKG